MEIESRTLHDRAEEDEEEKEGASRWTGLSVQSVSLWTGLGLGRLSDLLAAVQCCGQGCLFLPCLGSGSHSSGVQPALPHTGTVLHPLPPLWLEEGYWDR